jgi:large-conductance mechanosensitive channel
MDQPGRTFTPEGPDTPKTETLKTGTHNWIGQIIVAVILGEAIWNLIVSVMNNLVVPWLGDVMGQSSGLPTSFTQRPYNYPDLFVSAVELCIAGIIAAILNHFFRQRKPERAKRGAGSVPTAPVETARVVPHAMAPAALTRPAMTYPAPTDPAMNETAPLVSPPVPAPKPVIAPAPVAVAPAGPAPVGAQASVTKSVAVTPQGAPVANSESKPLPSTPTAGPPQPPPKPPSKPTKPKEVYYNIVGEPMPSDED